MSERTFWYTIKRYADAKELDDYKYKPRPPNDPYRKFTDEDYKDVIKTSDDTREEQNARFANLTQIHFQPIYDVFNSELVVLVAGMSGDHTLSLKALEELCRLCPNRGFQIRSDGGSEFDNKT
jgi:hypothetical protein